MTESPVFLENHLGKGAVDIHPYDTTNDLSPIEERKRRATRHLRIRALGATGQVAGAASY
jgi:hypothetical protein